jgi:hypothetical protein
VAAMGVRETFEKSLCLDSTQALETRTRLRKQDSPAVIEWPQQLSQNDLAACLLGVMSELGAVHPVPTADGCDGHRDRRVCVELHSNDLTAIVDVGGDDPRCGRIRRR